MKNCFSISIGISLVLFATLLGGCKSSNMNPAGVYGNGVILEDWNANSGIPMTARFTGGTEHPGMFAPVYFAYDSSQVAATERAKVETVINYLKQNSAVDVIVEGHCDERGSREYNLALGERRAQAVRSYLSDLGISSERIQTKSLGEEAPANPGHDEAAWSANRRAEFVLYY